MLLQEEARKMTLIESIIIKLGIAPKPGYDAGMLMARAKVILVANKMGVFNKLSRHPMSASELAKELGGQEQSLSMLLEALVAVGYLKRKDGSYQNAKIAQKWLIEGSASYIGNFLRHLDDLSRLWVDLEEAVRTDKPAINWFDYCSQNPEVQHNFTLGMKDGAVFCAREIVSKVKVPSQPRRLLDLGGAHGYYSVEFCRQYPQLSALVIDMERAVGIGREVVSQENMSHRVSFRVGDCITDDIGTGYDIALLFALLHAQPPEANLAILKRVHAALNPRGVIAITEVLSYKGKRESEFGLLFALNMLVATPRGRAYSYDEVKGWLEDIGFINIRRTGFLRLPGYSLLTATKPA